MQVNPAIFKMYDIRGIWQKDLTPDIAEAIGKAFATFVKPKKVVVGRDVRTSSKELQDKLVQGILSLGVDVTDVGVVTSDALYYSVGKYQFDGGVIVTASHNPPEWNGFKMMMGGVTALFGEDIKKLGEIVVEDRFAEPSIVLGKRSSLDIRSDYVSQVLNFSQKHAGRRLKIVIDPGNGAAARFIPTIMEHLPHEWEGIHMELDGTFPGRDPNPLKEGALEALKKRVIEKRADLGVAFDADADRMFFVDEKGNRVFGDVLTALLSQRILQEHPGAAIVYNLICSHTVPETITRLGGKPIRSRVGHAFMKQAMRENNAVFGGEISGHYFFQDMFNVDSGLVAMVVGMNFLSQQQQPLSEIVREVDMYAHDAEVNSKVDDIPGTLERIKTHYRDGKLDETDGVTVEYKDWWFNVRPSNTEPLLRLSVEAKTQAEMERRRDELLGIIRNN